MFNNMEDSYEELQDLLYQLNIENANWEFTIAFEEELPKQVNNFIPTI